MSRLKSVRYEGFSSQRLHWTSHPTHCMPPRATRAEKQLRPNTELLRFGCRAAVDEAKRSTKNGVDKTVPGSGGAFTLAAFLVCLVLSGVGFLTGLGGLLAYFHFYH
jgi:hypothetical protein